MKPDEMLLEREAPLRQALARVAALRDDAQGGCLLLHGEPGVGKSSLLRAWRAALPADVAWLQGQAEPMLSPTPFGPLLDMLDRLPPAMAAALRIGRLAPDLLAGWLALLRERSSPLVLVIDDAQWLDGATIDLLRFLARRLDGLRALLVLACRDDALTGGRPLQAFVGELPASRLQRLALQPLSAAAVLRLGEAAGRDGQALHGITRGNPFFVAELLACAPGTLPLAVQDAVLARAARLGEAARELLELVSTGPGGLELAVVDDLLGESGAAVDEALAAGLLAVQGEWLSFRHEIARRAVDAALGPQRRQSLHHAVLDALAVRGASAGRCVHHAHHAGLGAAVLRLAPEAAREAAEAGAAVEAAQLWRLALDHAGLAPAAARAALLDALATAEAATGRLEAARDARHQALRLHRQQGDLLGEGASRTELARLHWWLGEADAARTQAAAAIEVLEQAGAVRERAWALATMAQLHMLHPDPRVARDWGGRALEVFERLQDEAGLAHALNTVGFAELLGGDDAAAWARLERSLALALRHGLDDQVHRAYANLASMALLHRRLDDAARWCAEGEAHAQARDADMYVAALRIRRAHGLVEQGRWDDADALLAQVLQMPVLNPFEAAQAGYLRAVLDARRGRGDGGPSSGAAAPWYAPWPVVQAELAWLRQRDDELAAAVHEAWPAALAAGEGWRIGQLACWARRGGLVLSPDGLVPAPDGRVPAPDGLVPAPAGPRLPEPCARERAGDAAGAAAAWAALGCPYEQALALLGGDAAQVREAVQRLDALGAVPAARRARRRLRELGERAGTRGPYRGRRADPLGLTPRERAVHDLIVQGLSNRDIAARLVRSERTVEAHVAALLAKLGLPGREAVRAAARARGEIPVAGAKNRVPPHGR